MFETYAEEEDCLGMEGLCGLCEAVGIDPETDVRLLCFCWRVGAKKPSMILTGGVERGHVPPAIGFSGQAQKFVLGELCDPSNLDQKQFRDFFKFTFLFSRVGTSDHRKRSRG